MQYVVVNSEMKTDRDGFVHPFITSRIDGVVLPVAFDGKDGKAFEILGSYGTVIPRPHGMDVNEYPQLLGEDDVGPEGETVERPGDRESPV